MKEEKAISCAYCGAANEWISVEDRLPTDNEEYLVWPLPDLEMNIRTAEFQHWDKRWTQERYDGYGWDNFYPDVTHWMPLPEPPGTEE